MKTKTSNLKLDVKKSYAGLGLFAGEPIKKGTRIIEYVGEKVTAAEANKRGGMYLFEISDRWTIDGKDRKNTARYINHACGSAANCEAENNRGRIFILAKKNIATGDELCYDYGIEMFEEFIKPHGCRCASCGKKGGLTQSVK
jgi:SET domain-containing protein